MKKEIKITEAPIAIGPYSQGIQVGGMFFFSGQIPIDPQTNEIKEGIVEQTNQVLINCRNLLESQNLSFNNVVKTTVFLSDMKNFDTVNEIYASYFTAPFPARSAIEVSRLPKDVLVEIECIAIL